MRKLIAKRGAALCALVALLGCTADEGSSELALAIRSDLTPGTELASLLLEIATPLDATLALRHELATPAGFSFPFTLGVSRSKEPLVRITATGRDASGAPLVKQSVDAYFASGKLRFVELTLARRCVGVECVASQSCEPASGVCVPTPTALPVDLTLTTPEAVDWLAPQGGLDHAASGAEWPEPSAEARIRQVQFRSSGEFNKRMQQWCNDCSKDDGKYRCAWYLRSPYFSECEAEALRVGAKRLLPTYECLLAANEGYTTCISRECSFDNAQDVACSSTLESEFGDCYFDGESGPDKRLDRCFTTSKQLAGEDNSGLLFAAEELASADCKCASSPAQCLSSWLAEDSPHVRDCLAQAAFAHERATRSETDYALELALSCLQSTLRVAAGCVAQAACRPDAAGCLVQPLACGASSQDVLRCYRERRANAAP